jgi:hypothetical protein
VQLKPLLSYGLPGVVFQTTFRYQNAPRASSACTPLLPYRHWLRLTLCSPSLGFHVLTTQRTRPTLDAMPPVKRCAERCALSHRVIDAITEVCRVKNDYYLAKKKQPERVDALALGLKKARAAESAAVHALEEHTKQHGCRKKPGG